MREIMNKYDINIPDAIINYCIIYAFLNINEWFKGGDLWMIDDTKFIATKKESAPYKYTTICANPIISSGKHEWKIKIIEPELDSHSNLIYIGIASKINNFNSYFYGNGGVDNNYVWSSFGTKMDQTMSASIKFPTNKSIGYDKGDTITIHLDLDNKTVGFSKNDTFIGIAFENIKNDIDYRLAISVHSDVIHKIQILQ